jgi:hypothetical protein
MHPVMSCLIRSYMKVTPLSYLFIDLIMIFMCSYVITLIMIYSIQHCHKMITINITLSLITIPSLIIIIISIIIIILKYLCSIDLPQ